MDRKLTTGQRVLMGGIATTMVAFGSLGGWGTYTNIVNVFHRSATALGVVAAGEGGTLVLALTVVGLTLLGQSVPVAVRLGLWVLPLVASATGVAVVDGIKDTIVYAVTPLAMCVSAEGLGLLMRRVVVYKTGVDRETERRNAETMQKLAYLTARSKGHPEEEERTKAELAFWKLARKVGTNDVSLGSRLMAIQSKRMETGVDNALGDIFSVSPEGDAALSLETEAPSPQVETVSQELVPVLSLPKGDRVVPIMSLSSFVKGRVSRGDTKDAIRQSVKNGEYAGPWTEGGLKKALQRYAS